MGLNSSQRKVYGPRGKGEIRILPVKEAGNPKNWKEIKVTIFDDDGWKEVYSLDPQEVTKTFGTWQLQPVKDVFVELTADEEDIRSVRPFEGTFLLEFDRFAARQDMETGEQLAPTIKHKPAERVTLPNGQSWMNPPHDQFFAILRVAGSEIGKPTNYDGMETVKVLVYQFERNKDTGMVEIKWDRKFWYDQLINFLDKTGLDFDADTLTPSENVLGELQEILERRLQIFRGTFARGWLNRELDDAPVGITI